MEKDIKNIENEYLSPEYLRDVLVSVIKSLKVIKEDVTQLVDRQEKNSDFGLYLDEKIAQLSSTLEQCEEVSKGATVETASVNAKGELVLVFSNGKEVNVGVVKGKDGEDGDDGETPEPIKPDIDAIVSQVVSILERTREKIVYPDFNKMINDAVRGIKPSKTSEKPIDYKYLTEVVLKFINANSDVIDASAIKGLDKAIQYLLHQYRAQFISPTAISEYSWIDYCGGKIIAETTVADGKVYTYIFKGTTVYRHVTTAEDAFGYPVEDSFYTVFNNPTLSGFVISR